MKEDLCSTCLFLCDEADETGKQYTIWCGAGYDMWNNEDCGAYSKNEIIEINPKNEPFC
jgi:hypothetical protein